MGQVPETLKEKYANRRAALHAAVEFVKMRPNEDREAPTVESMLTLAKQFEAYIADEPSK